MRLDVKPALSNPGQAFPVAGTVSVPAMDVLGDPVSFSPVEFSGEMVGAGETVSIDAVARATVTSRCAKCLAEVKLPVEARLDDLFVREADAEHPDAYLFEGREIEVDGAVKDALLLELPIRFLCSDSCEGLCPICGANRNTQRCTCQEGGESTTPFSALSELLTKDEEV